MEKIARAKQEIFGSTGATSEFGVFGSDSEGAAATSKDPAVIQSLATYLRGLYGSTANATEPPRIQDMNALYYLFARQIAYGMQAGVPEWLATENYYANSSVVLGSDGRIYISKTGTDGSPNINNNPVSDTDTNWRFVLTNDAFIDCTSRVAEYTGDGIPLIPDNEAGRTYYKNKDFIDTTGWTAGSGVALTVENSMLKVVPSTPGTTNIYLNDSIYQNKTLSVIIKSSIPLTNITTVTGSTVFSPMSVQNLGGNRYLATIYWSRSNANSLNIRPDYGLATLPTWYLETIYIGTGAYDTPALDRAGNGNNLTLNAVTPVNGKYCKEMSFNGSTSFAQASSPVVGTTGTVAVRFKIDTTTTTVEIASNSSNDTLNGFRIRVAAGGSLNAFIAGSSSYQNISLGTIGLVSYNTIVISWDGTTVTKTVAGVTTTEAQTVTMTPALFNLTLGMLASGSNIFNGIISHFRYDSRIWTADEARAWSLNPSNGEFAAFSGNAIAADKWKTARNVTISDANGTNTGTAVSVDGSENETLKLPSTIKANLSGNASTAQTATNALACSGNSATATKLATARKIHGVNFDGTADVYDTYSTAEHRIGTWIDGKPIYRKVINFGALPNNTSKTVAHGISNLGDTIKLYGTATSISEGQTLQLPFVSTVLHNMISFSQYPKHSINITTLENWTKYTAIVIMEYTKTTD